MKCIPGATTSRSTVHFIPGIGLDCLTIANRFEVCTALSSNFDALPFSAQGSCVCKPYFGTAGVGLDDVQALIQTCHSYLSQAVPGLASGYTSVLNGICDGVAYSGTTAASLRTHALASG